VKVLVTGATGFVGSHTAKALVDAGHQVRLLVRSPEKARSVMHALGCTIDDIASGDVTDRASVERAVTGCDAVVHSAAMVSTAEKFAEQVYNTNVNGTHHVIDAALKAGVKKIVYVSSVSALFNKGDARMTEDSPVTVSDCPYGRTKVACEHYVRELQAKGAPIVITYPAGVVGMNDPALSEPHFGIRMFIAQFAFTSSTGMQFVSASDIARAHVQILKQVNGPDRFVLGGCYYSWQDLLDTSRRITGRRLPAIHIPGVMLRLIGKCSDIIIKLTGKELPLTGEGMTYATQWVFADSQKIEKELGFTFTPHDQTLAEAIRWLYLSGHLSAKKAGKLASA